MVKHTQKICRQIADELISSVFDHFIGLALKGLTRMHPFRVALIPFHVNAFLTFSGSIEMGNRPEMV